MKKAALSTCLSVLLTSWPSLVYVQGSLDQRIVELSQQISKEMTENQKRIIAVVEFVDLKGDVTNFGRFLAEELITRLYQTKKFKVIERQLLNKVIAEQKLSLTGVINPASAKQLGKLLGVDAIVSGTISDLAQSLRVNARLISTETGEIFAVASTEIFKDESVMRLLGAGPTVPPPPPGKTAALKVVAKDFVFELNSCKMSSGGSVICQFTIINDAAEDRRFSLYASSDASPSRLFDEVGNEYLASEGQLGSNKQTGYATLILVPHVVTKSALKFDSVNPEATTIKLLRLSCNDGSKSYMGEDFHADLRDIPIIK